MRSLKQLVTFQLSQASQFDYAAYREIDPPNRLR
jgi:hypothetical protein